MSAAHDNLTAHSAVHCQAILQDIHILMLDIGAVTRLKGFDYLCRAIEIVYTDPDTINNIVKGLYTSIAEEYGTTCACVERDIRTEVRYICGSGKMARLDEHYLYFDKSASLLSSRKFISLCAEKLRCLPGIYRENTDIRR